MRRSKRTQKSIFVRLLVIGVAVFMISTLIGLCNTLNEERIKLARLQEEYASLQGEIEELTYILSDESQTALIEKAARERFGYVYTNEEIYIDVSGN